MSCGLGSGQDVEWWSQGLCRHWITLITYIFSQNDLHDYYTLYVVEDSWGSSKWYHRIGVENSSCPFETQQWVNGIYPALKLSYYKQDINGFGDAEWEIFELHILEQMENGEWLPCAMAITPRCLVWISPAESQPADITGSHYLACPWRSLLWSPHLGGGKRKRKAGKHFKNKTP